jgi:hypothetical protein
LFCFAETSVEILQIIADWYAKAGDPLIETPKASHLKTDKSKASKEHKI